MKTSQQKYTGIQQFGVHIGKHGKAYTIFTAYNENKTLCAFVEPALPLVDPEFLHINAIMHQALDDRAAKQYFDTYETPKPLIYD